MYGVDFLPVENESGDGSKSGDAIVITFDTHSRLEPVVVVIDGGFQATGDDIISHFDSYLDGTRSIDLIISTHPDADHINGLATLFDHCSVRELMIHLPWNHSADCKEYSNLEAIETLVEKAMKQGTKITEPFAGESRFDDKLTILGPTQGFYETLLAESLEEERSGQASIRRESVMASAFSKFTELLERKVPTFPVETLTDDGQTSPRNNSSVITLIQSDDHNLLFTGDTGIDGLERACDAYDNKLGSFQISPLRLFQAPHHGSRRNLGPRVLDRMFGSKNQPFGTFVSFISSAKSSPKHPSPKVVNALSRRGGAVNATEGKKMYLYKGAPSRGWTSLTPLGPLSEDD